jgi:hypothetical protein
MKTLNKKEWCFLRVVFQRYRKRGLMLSGSFVPAQEVNIA